MAIHEMTSSVRRSMRSIAGTRTAARPVQRRGDATLANGLGWFSVGLGLADVVAPRAMARLCGVRPHPVLQRVLGLREIASGVAILAAKRPTAGLWSRVAGDAMDLALLGSAFTSPDTDKRRLLGATLTVCGVTALDLLGAVRWTRGAIRAVKTIAINRTPSECYAFWRHAEDLPAVLRAEEGSVLRDDPGELVAWGTGDDPSAGHGIVEFKPGPAGRGTMVQVTIVRDRPSATLRSELRDALTNAKRLLETGEIPTTEGQPSGQRSFTHMALAKLFTGGVS